MDIKIIANNKKAYHDYFIEETFQAGICLTGNEVKSMREGKCSIKEAFITFIGNEACIRKMNITPFEQANTFRKIDPIVDRKLLLHKKEINYLIGKSQEKGYTVVPLKAYIAGRYVKVDIGLARGKHNYDKRQDLKKKDAQRDMQRALGK
ncbi:MAG: SsrA-binding protein SmpB [Clostridium sp.]|nr:SsrA-binding protein SmpB [Clostridium sp.]